MRKRLSEIAVATVLLALVAACGGGGGSSNPPGAIPNAPTKAPGATTTSAPGGQTAPATIRITIPHAAAGSSAGRSPKLVTANTKSMTFTLIKSNGISLNGVVQGPYGLTASSPGCSGDAQGNVTCSLQLDAPLGDDLYVAQTFSSLDAAAGTQNGSGTLALTIARNSTNNANLVLNGPIASVVLAFGSIPQVGGSTRIFAVALDSSGSVVINPATYDQPIYLKLALGGVPAGVGLSVTYAIPGSSSAAAPTPAPGASTSVTPAPVPTAGGTASTNQDGGSIPILSPQDVITLTYQSAAQYAPPGQQIPTITAYVGSLAAAPQVPALQLPWLIFGAVPTPTPAPTSPPTGAPSGTLSLSQNTLTFTCASIGNCNPSPPPSITATYTGTGAISVDTSNCGNSDASIVFVSPVSGSSPFTFTAYPYYPGTCTLTVTAGNQTKTIAVTVGGALTVNGSTSPVVNCTLPSTCSPSSISMSESNFAGTFTVNQTSCAGIASIGSGPFVNGYFSIVSILGSGSCTVSISDGQGQSATIAISISAISIDHASFLCFTNTSICIDPGLQTVLPGGTLTETGASFSISLAPSCTNVANVPIVGPTNSPATFTVTALTTAGSCTATVSDGSPATAKISVTSVAPQLTLSDLGGYTHRLTGGAPTYAVEIPNVVSTAQPLSLTVGSNYPTGTLTVSADSCSNSITSSLSSASFTPSTIGANGTSVLTFNVTGSAAGTCSFTVQDASVASFTVNVGVNAPTLFIQGRKHR